MSITQYCDSHGEAIGEHDCRAMSEPETTAGRDGESEFPWEAYARALDEVAALVAGLETPEFIPTVSPGVTRWYAEGHARARRDLIAAIDSLRAKP